VSFYIAGILALMGAIAFALAQKQKYAIQIAGQLGLTATFFLCIWNAMYLVNQSAFVGRTSTAVHCFLVLSLCLLTYEHLTDTSTSTIRRYAIVIAATSSLVVIFNGLLFVRLGLMKRIYFEHPATLNGLEFFKGTNQYAIATWLRKHATAGERLVEAVGNSYSATARISSYSGVASMLAWPGHVRLRGIPSRDINRRNRAIQKLYGATTDKKAWQIAKRFDIRYIAVGDTERAVYTTPSLEQKFLQSQYFKLSYRKGNAFLFEVNSVQ
jgi:uncharacterized membrane protein